LRRGVDLVGLPVAVPAARAVRVWYGFPSGSFTVAHATLVGCAAATSDYWKPKTDKLDAIWLCKVAERQMILPSLVPPPAIRSR
jgi:hypothetical protein